MSFIPALQNKLIVVLIYFPVSFFIYQIQVGFSSCFIEIKLTSNNSKS